VITDLFWNTHVCFIGNSYTGPGQTSYFRLVKRCKNMCDWTFTPDKPILYSESLQAFKRFYQSLFHTTRTVQLLSQTDTHTSYFLSATVAADIPALQEVPSELWASQI